MADQKTKKTQDPRIAHQIAKHATRIAIASAVVAGVATLADKKTRDDLLTGGKKAMDATVSKTQDMTKGMQERYEAVSHKIVPANKKKTQKRTSSKKA